MCSSVIGYCVVQAHLTRVSSVLGTMCGCSVAHAVVGELVMNRLPVAANTAHTIAHISTHQNHG